jgi:hypothetical protein
MRPKFNYTKLHERIHKNFGTLEAFALVVGFSLSEIRAKLSNSADFKFSDMDKICECLGIENEEIDGIFFEV